MGFPFQSHRGISFGNYIIDYRMYMFIVYVQEGRIPRIRHGGGGKLGLSNAHAPAYTCPPELTFPFPTHLVLGVILFCCVKIPLPAT